VLIEHAPTFEDFTALVLGFRKDPECVVLTWQPVRCEPGSAAYLSAAAAWRERIARHGVASNETPEPVMYDHAGQCPWNQSVALDFELAEADYQRWLPVA